MKISNLMSEIDLSLGQILVGNQVLILAPGQNDALLALVAAQMPVAAAPRVVKERTKRQAAPEAPAPVEPSGRGDKQRAIWAERKARVAEGFCAFCTKKHMSDSNFCKKHHAAKYPKKFEAAEIVEG